MRVLIALGPPSRTDSQRIRNVARLRGAPSYLNAADAVGETVPASPRPVAHPPPDHSHRATAFAPPSASSVGQLI